VADPHTMTVSFDQERCIACELCLPVCPYQAVEILF
jgi:Fe-S-cluster-containing hydrogenase component 2